MEKFLSMDREKREFCSIRTENVFNKIVEEDFLNLEKVIFLT